MPSGLGFRFALLATAVLGACVFIYDVFYLAFAPGVDLSFALSNKCMAAAPAPGGGEGDPLASTYAFLRCAQPFERDTVWWVLGGIALLVMVVGAAYWWEPTLRVRFGGLEHFEPDEDPEQAAMMSRLAELTRAAGLRQPPRFLLSRRSQYDDAAAFGRAGRYTVRIDMGLAINFRGDPVRFQAIVLHELAHLRNRDVDIAGLTRALFFAFLPLGLLPLIAALIRMPPGDVLDVGWRAAVLVALVFYGRRAVLRARECGADQRAASWSVTPEDLFRATGPSTLRRLLAHAAHPSPQERTRVMRHPQDLFRVGFWDCCVAGLAAMTAVSGFRALLWMLFHQADPLYGRATAVVLFAPAIAAVMGMGIWRTTWLTASTRGTALPALGLATGLIVGQSVALPHALATSRHGLWLGGTAAGAVCSAVLLALLVLLSWWIARSALAWLPQGSPLARKAWMPAWLVSSALLTVLLTWWMLVYDQAHNLSGLNDSLRAEHAGLSRVAPAGPYVIWSVVEHPLMGYFAQWTPVVAALVLLWAWPLASQLRHPARGGWVRTVAVASAAGTAAYLGGVLALRLQVRVDTDAPATSQDAVLLLFAYWQVTAAMLVQGLVAVVVAAALIRHHGRIAVLYGLLAAFLTGCLVIAVFFGGVLAAGCVDALAVRPASCTGVSLPWVRNTMLRILTGGALIAVAGVTAVALLRGRSGRLPPREPSSHPPAGSCTARRFVWAVTILGYAVTLVGFTVPERDERFAPQRTADGPVAACAAYDDLLGSMSTLSPSQVIDRLEKAEQLAVRDDAPELGEAFVQLFLISAEDSAAFAKVSERIQKACATAGRPLINLP
ncbi:M48 family metalloprotease [Streptomyces avermitilis]